VRLRDVRQLEAMSRIWGNEANLRQRGTGLTCAVTRTVIRADRKGVGSHKMWARIRCVLGNQSRMHVAVAAALAYPAAICLMPAALLNSIAFLSS
jgi:hypothetical protein